MRFSVTQICCVHSRSMVRDDVDQWARRFSADLGSGEARAPFDRIVRRYLSDIQALLDRDLTFPTLAAALTRAGALRHDGNPYRPDHLYVAVNRAVSHAQIVARGDRRAVAQEHAAPAPPRGPKRRASQTPLDPKPPQTASPSQTKIKTASSSRVSKAIDAARNDTVDDGKDITQNDISTVLRRLRKSVR